MFPTLPILTAGLTNVTRALSFTKNGPCRVLPVSGICRYVEEVLNCLWSPPPKLVDNVAELPELFQLKCLSPASKARPHLNGNNPSIPRI
jgi:hypothetical protein